MVEKLYTTSSRSNVVLHLHLVFAAHASLGKRKLDPKLQQKKPVITKDKCCNLRKKALPVKASIYVLNILAFTGVFYGEITVSVMYVSYLVNIFDLVFQLDKYNRRKLGHSLTLDRSRNLDDNSDRIFLVGILKIKHKNQCYIQRILSVYLP